MKITKNIYKVKLSFNEDKKKSYIYSKKNHFNSKNREVKQTMSMTIAEKILAKASGKDKVEA
ncbi:MAG: hypothetical protein BZ138_03515, partial [Methanosphaera sp. rholeuAM270]